MTNDRDVLSHARLQDARERTERSTSAIPRRCPLADPHSSRIPFLAACSQIRETSCPEESAVSRRESRVRFVWKQLATTKRGKQDCIVPRETKRGVSHRCAVSGLADAGQTRDDTPLKLPLMRACCPWLKAVVVAWRLLRGKADVVALGSSVTAC
ncbi:hypothetical protein MRX96_059243 [Rhipicephalus microplus]